jgi:hypothetical protein
VEGAGPVDGGNGARLSGARRAWARRARSWRARSWRAWARRARDRRAWDRRARSWHDDHRVGWRVWRSAALLMVLAAAVALVLAQSAGAIHLSILGGNGASAPGG